MKKEMRDKVIEITESYNKVKSTKDKYETIDMLLDIFDIEYVKIIRFKLDTTDFKEFVFSFLTDDFNKHFQTAILGWSAFVINTPLTIEIRNNIRLRFYDEKN